LDTPAVPVKVPSGVFFVAITRAGERLVAVGEHGVVICSDDEGATWWQAQVPVTVTLTCVAFATPLLGWAAGHFGVILATTDGGKTWVEQLNGIQVNQLALAAAQAIPPGDTTSPAFALGLKRAEFFVQLGPDKPFLTLVALSSQNIMVFGAYRMAVVTNGSAMISTSRRKPAWFSVRRMAEAAFHRSRNQAPRHCSACSARRMAALSPSASPGIASARLTARRAGLKLFSQPRMI